LASCRITAADINIGIIYLIAVTSVGVYGVVLGGWASNNKYSFLGGLRASAQMISYEIPLGISLLCVILLAGTIRPTEIITQQIDGTWYLLQHPIIAVIFYTCLLAEANRARRSGIGTHRRLAHRIFLHEVGVVLHG
jgi:NADH-quinone oxidoreductase subunit H